MTDKTDKLNVFETAVKSGKFTTFEKVLSAVGLNETLKKEGPYTIFAPTDEAFAKIPQDKLKALLLPANKETLTTLLRYHVVPGKLMSSEIANSKTAKTLMGQELKIDGANGFRINEAKVVTPDIQASNGVLHAIDAVLMPQIAATAN